MSIFHVLKYPISDMLVEAQWTELPDTIKIAYSDWWMAQDPRPTMHECTAKIRSILANYEDEL